jgi:glutamine---fructose-6-phosphate transaminase (isomerizing)
MCGIVGYTGSHEAAPILVAGLRRLEYRDWVAGVKPARPAPPQIRRGGVPGGLAD